MEVIVTLVRLVYHDASSIGLELEVADAVKFYVLHLQLICRRTIYFSIAEQGHFVCRLVGFSSFKV